MRTVSFMLCVTAMVFANDDGCTEILSSSSLPSTDGITLSVLNTFSPGQMSLGMDIYEGSSSTLALAANPNSDMIQFYDASSGSPQASMDLSSANTNCFCAAFNDDLTNEVYYTDDWNNNNLFYTDDSGSTWATVTSPVLDEGKGMDFDGTDYWITDFSLEVCRFQPGGSYEMLSTPQIPSQLSGLTVFPYNGSICLAVTAYSTLNIWFYTWNGSTLSFMGSAPCPGSPQKSYGLAYSESRGTIFWSYKNSSEQFEIAELSFDITALSRNTWAGIKTSF